MDNDSCQIVVVIPTRTPPDWFHYLWLLAQLYRSCEGFSYLVSTSFSQHIAQDIWVAPAFYIAK